MSELYRRGLVALSADPITFGHLDLISRSAAMCRELIVLVANNNRKLGSYCFPLAERTSMVERAIANVGMSNVRVAGSSGLLVDLYLREGCDRLFRGVRNDKDLDFEEEQAELNRMILPSLAGRIEYLKAAKDLKLVSSSLVKELVDLRLDVDKFVPMFVKRALEEKRLGQCRVTVTGGISVGKSWVAAELARMATASGLQATHVNIDQLLRDLYDEASPGAQMVRDALAARFGDGVLTPDGMTVDRRSLAEWLFARGADGHRKFVIDLTMPHIARKYREASASAKGLVILEWAQSAEMDMGSWTNNNVIVVDSRDRAAFMAKRGIPPERAAIMDEIQWSAERKAAVLGEKATRDRSGTVILFENRLRGTEAEARVDVAALFSELRKLFPSFLTPKT